MDIVRKRGVKGSQGNSTAEFSDIIARAGSWQYGNDASYGDVEAEKKEEDLKFGVPNDWKDDYEDPGFADQKHDEHFEG